MPKTDQLLLRPPVELIDRLEKAAEKYRKEASNRNQVAVEVLDQYLEFWEQAEEAKLAVMSQQRAGLLEASQPYMSGRGTKGEAERVRKDAQAREEKKRRGNR
jgi:hypothetical protein